MPGTPYQRNFLDEARRIARGDKRISPKREHILAITDQLGQLAMRMEKLQTVMKALYSQASELRKAQGKPLPPPPPGFT